MLTVNLFDGAFAHNLGSSVHGKTAKRLRYVRSHLNWSGITLITDSMLTESRVLDVLKSKVTIGWLLEPREYRPESYNRVVGLFPKLDLLLTHDKELLDRYPEKCRFVPFGGCWIKEENFGLYPKSRWVSMIYSAKRFLTGHRLRHHIAAEIPHITLMGHGSGLPIKEKEFGLLEYRFSIAIENSRVPNFFTEKLLDCFATGTVPIYWGCPNIGEFFDERGIIQFEKIEELPAILESLNYEQHLEGVKNNLERFRPFEITDDWIAEHVLEKL